MLSECRDRFGHDDFDALIGSQWPAAACPVKQCGSPLSSAVFEKRTYPYCAAHGIRIHRGTFVYCNGGGDDIEGRTRNFVSRPDLAREIPLGASSKVENSRLGHEMSEDALTWNVFVGLADKGKLRGAVRYLTGREVTKEPRLLLWGELIDVRRDERGRFEPLKRVREQLEPDIDPYKTEPDIILVSENELLVCVEAKFASGNPMAHESIPKPGEKPTDRASLLERYYAKAGQETKRSIDPEAVPECFCTQLFRNVVFAAEMSEGIPWHVVNLVSSTQWSQERAGEAFFDVRSVARRWGLPECGSARSVHVPHVGGSA